jgi:hypothetical protein
MMNLRVVAQTNTTITLGWDQVAGTVEYRGTRAGYVHPDGSQRWSQAAPGATQMKFQKAAWYEVQALKPQDSGRYPAVASAVFPSTTRYPSEVL